MFVVNQQALYREREIEIVEGFFLIFYKVVTNMSSGGFFHLLLCKL